MDLEEADREWRQHRRRVLLTKWGTIRACTVALLQYVHHRDSDGREIGLDYATIYQTLRRKFPDMKPFNPGAHGTFHQLMEEARAASAKGYKLPFRPMRPRMKRVTA